MITQQTTDVILEIVTRAIEEAGKDEHYSPSKYVKEIINSLVSKDECICETEQRDTYLAVNENCPVHSTLVSEDECNTCNWRVDGEGFANAQRGTDKEITERMIEEYTDYYFHTYHGVPNEISRVLNEIIHWLEEEK